MTTITFGKHNANGMPSVTVKGCEAVFADGKEIGAVWWMGAVDNITPYHVIINKQEIGKFSTEVEAKAAVQKHFDPATNSTAIKVEMSGEVYESKSGELEGRIVRERNTYRVETRVIGKPYGWKFAARYGYFGPAIDTLEAILNAN